jgi:hypothetical protein
MKLISAYRHSNNVMRSAAELTTLVDDGAARHELLSLFFSCATSICGVEVFSTSGT